MAEVEQKGKNSEVIECSQTFQIPNSKPDSV